MDTVRRICSSLRDTSRKPVRLGDGALCVRDAAQGAAEVLAVPCLCSSSRAVSLQCRAGSVWVGVLRSGMSGRGQPRDLCCLGVHSGFWNEFRRDLPHPNPAVRAPGHARSAGADWHITFGDDGEARLKPPVSGIVAPHSDPHFPAVVVGM